MKSVALYILIAISPLLQAQQQSKCPSAPSSIVVNSGLFSSQPGVSFQLRHFHATLIPRGDTPPSCFEKTTAVSRAEIFVSNESLTNVFATKLGDANSKIKDLKIENGLTSVKLNGRMTKILPVEFSIEGPVTTDGSLLLLHADHIKADGIPVKGLLEILGQHLSSVLGLDGVAGVSVHENTLAFSPEQIAHLRGHIQSVETSPAGLTLRYAPAASRKKTPVSKPAP